MENNQISICQNCGTRYLKKFEYFHKFQECNGQKKNTIFDNLDLKNPLSEDSLYALNLQNHLNSGIINNINNDNVNNNENHSEDSIYALNLHNQINNNNGEGNIPSEDSIFAINLQNKLYSEPSNADISKIINNNNNNLHPIEEEVSEINNSLSNLNINSQINNNNNNNENSEEEKIEENQNSGRIVFRLSGLAMLGVLINFLEQIENESNQVDEKLLKRIPEIEVSDKNKLSDDNKKCTICQDEYNNKDKVIVLPCLHFFHTDCIKNWFSTKNTCPNCKFLLTKSNLYNQEGFEETPEESLRNISQIRKK